MFNWDDARYLVAVARHGSTVAASRALGVNQSTVQRRLVKLERHFGLQLVHRSAAGYRLTESGLAILPRAEALVAAAEAVEQQVKSLKSELGGTVRLTCPEPIVSRLTGAGMFSRLQERLPGIRLKLVTSDRYVDLSTGEADVALRSGEPQDESLVGRKVADSHWALYASKDYVAQHGRPADLLQLRDHPIIGFGTGMEKHRASLWLASTVPEASIASRNDSVLGVLAATKAGIGIAALPTTLGDADADLIQVLPLIPELTRGWYLLSRVEARRHPNIAAVIQFFVDELPALRRVLMG